MKKSLKFIGFIILFLAIVIGGIFAYQVFGVSDETNWNEKEQIDIEQEEDANKAVEEGIGSDIFD